MKLFIFIACTCIYTATAETVRFIQQPTTDEQCYEEGDNGTLTLSFNVTGTSRLDNYIVALTESQEGTGRFKSNGTELNFHDATDRDIQHDRYRVTMSYVGRTVEYRLDITVLKFLDETSGLYAFIIESHSGKFKSKSSVNATFRVEKTCPQRPQPTTASVTNKGKGDSHEDHTSDPKEPSTTTAPPNILAKPTICEVFCTRCFYILLAICLGIFSIIVFILYWFCIKRTKPKRKWSVHCSGTPMGLGSLRNGNRNL